MVPSPGHSPDHVAFLDTRDRTLIAGDVFTSFGKVQVSNHFYLRFPLAAMATFDKAQDLRFAQALRALDPALLVVGHGPAVPAPAAAMDAAIAGAYRAYAHAHPGTYAATQVPSDRPDHQAAAAEVVAVMVAVLGGYGLEGEDAIHAVRAVRSALHGFVALEREGGFQLSVALQESYDRLIAMLDSGLAGLP